MCEQIINGDTEIKREVTLVEMADADGRGDSMGKNVGGMPRETGDVPIRRTSSRGGLGCPLQFH